jgi:hypothetical protein
MVTQKRTSEEALVACFYYKLEMKVSCVKWDLATKEYMLMSKTSLEHVFLSTCWGQKFMWKNYKAVKRIIFGFH